jgi:hypothetical protein
MGMAGAASDAAATAFGEGFGLPAMLPNPSATEPNAQINLVAKRKAIDSVFTNLSVL